MLLYPLLVFIYYKLVLIFEGVTHPPNHNFPVTQSLPSLLQLINKINNK